MRSHLKIKIVLSSAVITVTVLAIFPPLAAHAAIVAGVTNLIWIWEV